MLKKILFTFHFSLFTLLCALAQSNDPIVMRINGQPVTRSEFEYNYNKNNTDGVVDKKGLEEYVDLFINYKLKVQAAMDDHLDTLSSYKAEFRQYRDQQIKPLLVPEGAAEKEVRAYYDNMLKSLEGHDLYLPAHIFVHLQQTATNEEKTKAKARIDSIYNALKAGANFDELARKCSDDKQTGMRGGVIRWVGPHQLLPELEEVMYTLRDSGEVAAPFLSTVGYHIIQLKGRKPLESYGTLHPQIENYLQQRGLAEQLAEQAVDSLSKVRNISKEELLDQETEKACAKDDELKYLVQEYHDGLLLFEECTRKVWEPAAADTTGIEKFFKKNKKKYAWTTPHFNGMIYHCRKQSDVKAVQKMLKGVKPQDWTKVVRDNFNKDSVTVRMEPKMFVQGSHALADSLIFKVKGVKVKPRKDFLYSGFVGKMLKKGPATWTDVSADVVADYQAKREEEFVAELRKRYAVEVYKDVLKTVNNH
ncbi:MAG: peptidylprolyl isomerase [Bacteroidales bacterium]|nr:peptidylprolyl isomerase [Bacteroidales bacterium]